ncbi:HypC/HybG/HupF family hydrogenase formation chaperone [Candidatus Aenigmatarchaeota archaeon]
MNNREKDGFGLFMRFADGCRCYLMDKGVMSEDDNKAIINYFRLGKEPDQNVVKRVYYVAWPGLEQTSERMGKGMFDPDVIREFYAFDHNTMKVEQGNYICIAFPAKILEIKGNQIFVDLSPVTGKFWIESDPDTGTDLKKGDWVIIHRMNVIEKISAEYAKRVSDHLESVGMKREMRFPRKAIKYLNELKKCQGVDAYA